MATIIAAIAGSLRAGSYSRALLRAAARDLPPEVELAIWDGLESVPPFNEDLEAGPAPAGVAALRRLIAGADAVLIATPEYNGSIPGQLKNALDWASRPRGAAVLQGKPARTRIPRRLFRHPAVKPEGDRRESPARDGPRK